MFNAYIENFITIHFSIEKENKIYTIRKVDAKVYNKFRDLQEQAYVDWAINCIPDSKEASVYYFGVLVHGLSESIMYIQCESNESFKKAIEDCFKKITESIQSVSSDIIKVELN